VLVSPRLQFLVMWHSPGPSTILTSAAYIVLDVVGDVAGEMGRERAARVSVSPRLQLFVMWHLPGRPTSLVLPDLASTIPMLGRGTTTSTN